MKKYILSVFICSFTFVGYGQKPSNTTNQNQVLDSLEDVLVQLQEKIEKQALELSVLKNLQKIDTVQFGIDSMVVLFVGKNGNPIKTIKIKYGQDKNGIRSLEDVTNVKYYKDSIITYYTAAGLMAYREEWDETYSFKGSRALSNVYYYWTKLTWSRYEYNTQNKLKRRLKVIPDADRLLETIYDTQNNRVANEKWIPIASFWGDIKETLKK